MERPKPPDPKTRKPAVERPHVIVCGSRTFTDYPLLRRKLDRLLATVKDPLIVHGGAKGADALAAKYAEWYWYEQSIYHADWEHYGKSAGPRRNKDMIEGVLSVAGRKRSVLIAFHLNNSPGTRHAIDYATERGMKVKVIEVTE